MIQLSRLRAFGVVLAIAAAVSLPLSASAATHARTRTNRPSPRISCGRDYLGNNGSCVLDLATLGLFDAASTPEVAIIHIGPRAQAGASLDAEIDPEAIEIVAPSTSPAAAASYVAQQLHQYAAEGQPMHMVLTVGGTSAVSPAFNRAIAPAVAPAATFEVGGSNAVDGTLALADALMMYQRGGVSAVNMNLAGLAAVATRGYGTLLWPAKH